MIRSKFSHLGCYWSGHREAWNSLAGLIPRWELMNERGRAGTRRMDIGEAESSPREQGLGRCEMGDRQVLDLHKPGWLPSPGGPVFLLWLHVAVCAFICPRVEPVFFLIFFFFLNLFHHLVQGLASSMCWIKGMRGRRGICPQTLILDPFVNVTWAFSLHSALWCSDYTV